MKIYLCIVETKTGKVVKATDISNKSEREVEKMETARNINLNHSQYHTRQMTQEELDNSPKAVD